MVKADTVLLIIGLRMEEEESQLSEKDLQLIKSTYRTIIENYYENPNEDSVSDVMSLNQLAMQSIGSRRHSESLLVTSMLEVLRVKAKSHPDLSLSVQETIIHLKNPMKVYLKDSTIRECMERVAIFPLCCTLISRRFESELKPRAGEYDWREILMRMGRNADKAMKEALEGLGILLPQFSQFCKDMSRSGLVKILFSVYLVQYLEDKNSLYRVLKVLKIVSHADRTVLIGREKNLGTVIYTHPKYTQIAREIAQNCYDHDYCTRLLASHDIDPIFLWSHNRPFCQLASQPTIHHLQQLLLQERPHIPSPREFKIYTILNNLVRAKQTLRVDRCWEPPLHSGECLNAYLRLLVGSLHNDPKDFKRVQMKQIEDMYQRATNSDPVTERLIQELKALDPESGPRKVGQLRASLFSLYQGEKNNEALMEKAMLVPKSDSDTAFLKDALQQKPPKGDEFEKDALSTIRCKALDSLRIGIAENHPINLGSLFKALDLTCLSPQELNTLFKVAELRLTMDPALAKEFDPKKLVEMVEWLENNHGLEIIDWVAVGQVLEYVLGPDEWKAHINDIPGQCFWLLNAYHCEASDSLFRKMGLLRLDHEKVPLMVGFIGKTGDPQLKKTLLTRTPMPQHLVSKIGGYNSQSHTSVEAYMSVNLGKEPLEALEMKRYLNNVLNLSHLIFDWSKDPLAAHIEQKIIGPVLPSIYRSFHGSEAEFRFLENSLPVRIDLAQLKDMNVVRLMETHGNLASYLHRNKYEGKMDLSKIGSLGQLLHDWEGPQVEQILRFLETNEAMMDGQDLNNLLDLLLANAKGHHKYWKVFPNYIPILNHLVSIAGRSSDPEVAANLTPMLEKVLSGTTPNHHITPDELTDLYHHIHQLLQRALASKSKLDPNRLLPEVSKIQAGEWRDKLRHTLKQMEAMGQSQGNKVRLQAETATLSQEKSKKYGSGFKEGQSPKDGQPLQLRVGDEDEKGENFEKGLEGFDTEQAMGEESGKAGEKLSKEERELVEALGMLRKVIKKERPKELFPGLVEVFRRSEFTKVRKYLLGHSLTEYYKVIERDEKVLELLRLRDKTNLSKSQCYWFLSSFQEAFSLARRWKLLGHQFTQLAIQRMQTKDEALKSLCLEHSFEVAEYNLLKTPDLDFFFAKQCHRVVMDALPRVTQVNEGVYYLLLIGTSARLPGIKTSYIEEKMHLRLMEVINRAGWDRDKHLVANLSYAVSSLAYTQNHICIEVVSKKAEMEKMLWGYEHWFAEKKVVVEAGCSLLSNLCYSNRECKEILFQYGVDQTLITFMVRNMDKPEVSTFKQIIRAMGNLSLHKGCVHSFIDRGLNKAIVDVISKFDILFYRDEERLKILKLTIDLACNMASQKYQQQRIHQEGVTDLVITLLETTEISEDYIMMGCIDTIDGLCQEPVIENYCVMDKRLPYLLIDLLKVREDEKLITKSIRLLTNLTLSDTCIPYVLEANLLSVLANIVLPMYRNPKMEVYVNKIMMRIFSQKPAVKQIIKSGYLDCLLKTVDFSPQNVEDSFIDLMLHYSHHFPSYLSNRAFLALVKFLSIKQADRHCVDRIMKVLRIMFTSEEKKEDQDQHIQGALQAYEAIYSTRKEDHSREIVFLLALHAIKSRKFKATLLLHHRDKNIQLITHISTLSNTEPHKEFGLASMFAVLNHERGLFPPSGQVGSQEDRALAFMRKGCKCKLFRADGSSKQAVVDLDQENMLRAYKYPNGEIKKKYTMSVRQIRDWQFALSPTDLVWKQSVFAKNKSGFFDSECSPKNCVIMLGSIHWGEFSFMNLEFETIDSKRQFVEAMSVLLLTFKR